MLSKGTLANLRTERRTLEMRLAKTEEATKAINLLISLYPLGAPEAKKTQKPSGVPTQAEMVHKVLKDAWPSALTTDAIRSRMIQTYGVKQDNIAGVVKPLLQKKHIRRIRQGKYKHVPAQDQTPRQDNLRSFTEELEEPGAQQTTVEGTEASEAA